MTNVYDSVRLATGYAFHRPALHARFLDVAQLRGPVPARALDIGCGAGLSTAALQARARAVVGVEPMAAMLTHSRAVAPGVLFVVASAERLPFADDTFELATAAGSLNYVDMELFWQEIIRALKPGGRLVIYDFYEGRHAQGDDRLARWYSEFETRFPWPPGWRPFDPRELPNLDGYTDVEIALPMEYEEYARYALSEVNVDSALRGGIAPEEVDWCRDSLRVLFDRPMTVLFRGYTSVLTPSTPWHRYGADPRSPE